MNIKDTQLKKKIEAFRCPNYIIKGKSPFCPKEVKFILELIHSAVEEAYKKGKKSSIWSAAFRAKLTFIQNYVVKLGFLDGVQGFTLALTDAINKFFKYAKLNEMNRKDKSTGSGKK